MNRILFAVLFAAGIVSAQQPAQVKVEGGLLQGTLEDGLTVYRGHPVRGSTVGDLRWRAPEAAHKWNGVRQASKFGAACIQAMNPGDAAQASGISEDCLYLNVWTPAKSAKDRIPVLVWIYGGGFNAGATSNPRYSGEKLASKGVVLVSIGYRVGPWVFWRIGN